MMWRMVRKLDATFKGGDYFLRCVYILFYILGRSGGARNIDIYHDLLYVSDKKANKIYTVPRNGDGLTDGGETEITLMSSGNPIQGLQNSVFVTGEKTC